MSNNFKQKTASFKIQESTDDLVLEGYASTFGFPADRQGDIINEAAFNETIANVKANGIPFLDSHENSCLALLGTVVDAFVDSHGLFIKVVFADTPQVREIYAKAKQGHVTKMSIGFQVEEGRYIETNNGEGDAVFEIMKADLLEVSLVPIPANPRASVVAVKTLLTELQKCADCTEQELPLIEVEKSMEIEEESLNNKDLGEDVGASSNEVKTQLLKAYLQLLVNRNGK